MFEIDDVLVGGELEQQHVQDQHTRKLHPVE
jgi:hypothetical protein